MQRSVAGLLLASIIAAAPAHATLMWHPREQLPGILDSVALGPDGLGLLFGFNFGNKRYIERPVGGPLGALQPLPAGLNPSADPPFVAWFPDGSSLIAHGDGSAIAFRPAGAGSTIGTPQTLSGFEPLSIAAAASGAALVGFTGTVRVAARPAGAGSTVDLMNAQSFGAGQLIGVVEDPAGGAVVVFRSGNALMQAVRMAGQSTFASPTEIVAPGLGEQEFQVRMAADPSGHAVLGWLGESPSSTSFGDTIVAATRAPGGAFGTPNLVATTPEEDSVSVLPGVTSSGSAIVVWTQLNARSICMPPRDHDFGAYYAMGTTSGGFGMATPLGGVAWPDGSGVEAVASAGDRFAIAFFKEHHSESRCTANDSTRELFVRTGTGGNLEAETSIATSHMAPGGGFQIPIFESMAVNSSGGVLIGFNEGDGAGGFLRWVRVREDRPTVTTSPTPTPIVTATGVTPTMTPTATPTRTATATPTGTATATRTPTPTPTVVRPPHVGDPDAAKATDKCAAGTAKAAATFVKKTLKTLEKCADGLFICIQTKVPGAKRDACVIKAQSKCDGELGKTAAERAKLTAAFDKVCGGLDDAHLLDEAGLGFGGDASQACDDRFGTPVTNAASAALCVRSHHECAAGLLFALQMPRARELFETFGVALPSCLDGVSGSGLDVGDTDLGKALEKCQKAIKKAGATFATKKLKSLQKCVDAVLGCVQLKSDPADFPACLAKADGTCDKEFTKIAAAAAAIAPAIDKKCDTLGAPLFDAAGTNLDAPAGDCAGLGVDPLVTLDDYEECLFRQHECLVEDLMAFETPRAEELLDLVDRELRSTFCPR